MSLKSTLAHLLNDMVELVYPSSAEGYRIYTGVDRGLSRVFYTERMVELPFVFEQIGKRKDVLDVGCSESTVCIQLAMHGYRVTGIDMQDYKYKHKNFKFIKADFLKHEFDKKFDTIISISAIEHFGITAYKNRESDLSADKKAIGKIRNLLKENGQFIFTAPFGISALLNDERIYSREDVKGLFEGFRIDKEEYYRVKGHKEIIKTGKEQAATVAYSPNDYCVVLIDATKTK